MIKEENKRVKIHCFSFKYKKVFSFSSNSYPAISYRQREIEGAGMK